MTPTFKLAVDIGGTFTDLVLSDGVHSHSAKVLTTPHAPEEGVLAGVEHILALANVCPSHLALVIHGTTLATNALIERKGARTALITTEGFRDAVEIAYEHRFDQYDLYMERPEPLVPRHLRFTVPERIAADGSVLLALDGAVLADVAVRIEAHDIESIAVCFLHSYANAVHENAVAKALARRMPEVPVTLSSVVCPEIREYERVSTTCASAYVQPLMGGYLRRLEKGLAMLGLDCSLLLMMSSGGVTTVDTAVTQPIRLVESGPAGGVILAQQVAACCAVEHALSFDMGGTTAKLTLIDALTPQYNRSFEVARQQRFLKGSGLPIRIPVIDMVEIGAGGGSIARVDELGRISAGPNSAGADPGPACYVPGGDEPTVTDADVVLGRIDPENFAGGKIRLDAGRALRAIEHGVAAPLGLESRVAAAGIAEIVDENMASAARVHAVENGKDTAERTLIATGGAAPLHAARVADKLGITRVIVPRGAGVGSAHGFLCAPISYEVVRTRLMRLDVFDASALNELFQAMREEALAVVRLGAPDAPLTETREAYMRYRGQGHEITVALPAREFRAEDHAEVHRRFEAQYTQVFGRVIPRLEVEVLTWALTLSTERTLPSPVETPPPSAPPAAESARMLFDGASGRSVQAAVHRRASLEPGMELRGPAIIVEDETTTVVPEGFMVFVHGSGHLVLLRE